MVEEKIIKEEENRKIKIKELEKKEKRRGKLL